MATEATDSDESANISTQSSDESETDYERLLGPTPCIKTFLSNVPLDCVIDTGAQVSTVTKLWCDQNMVDTPLHNIRQLKSVVANGTQLPYLGYIIADITILNKTVKEQGFFVIDSKDEEKRAPGLLGTNIMRHFPEVYDAMAKTAAENQPKIPQKSKKNKKLKYQIGPRTPRTRFARVKSSDNVRIPAGSSHVLELHCGRQDGAPILIEPLRTLPRGIIGTPSFITTSSCGMVVWNNSEEDIWLKPNSRIGTVSPAERVQHSINIEVINDELYVTEKSKSKENSENSDVKNEDVEENSEKRKPSEEFLKAVEARLESTPDLTRQRDVWRFSLVSAWRVMLALIQNHVDTWRITLMYIEQSLDTWRIKLMYIEKC